MAGITLTIDVDDKGTVKVKQFADESKKAFKEMTDGPKQAQGPLADLKEGWIGLTAKITAATAVVYGVSRAFSSFVNEAAEAEQIENRLRFALETTGYTWQYAKSAVDEFAKSVQASTRFSDEQARQALTDMTMYTRDFGKAQMGAKLAMDMSIRTGQDLGSTSRLIGMAMSGNVEMLGRYIPELRNLDAILGENATMSQKAEYALKILQQKFGGTAQADVKSYSGTVAQFKNAWSDLKEEIGMGLLPVLKDVFEWLTKATNTMKEFAFPVGGGEADEERRLIKRREGIEFEIGAWRSLLRTLEGVPNAQKAQLEIINKINAAEKERDELTSSIVKKDQEQIEIKKKLAAETKKDVFPVDLKKYFEEQKSYYESLSKNAEMLERTGNPAFEAFWEIFKGTDVDLVKLTKDTDIWFSKVQENLKEFHYEAPVTGAWTEMGLTQAEFEYYQETAQAATQARKEWAEVYSEVSEWQTIWESVGQNISNAWSSNMVNIIRSTESTSEKIKSFFQSIGDVFLSTVSKMITQWLIFGSVTGKKESGGSWLTGSLWSGLLGALFHGGGIVPHEGGTRTVPAAAFAFAPRLHAGFMPDEYPTVLKKGEGVFTPGQMKALGAEKKGGDTYVYFVNPIGFDQALMKNMGTILKGVAKDARMAGPMHSIMKGNG